MSLEIAGLAEMRRRLQRLSEQDRLTQAVAAGLTKTAEMIATEAKLQSPVGGPPFSPRDKAPGTMRASIHAALPDFDGAKVSVTIGGGGLASAYTRRQHEELTWRHHVGKAKFIEDPFEQLKGTAGDNVAEAIRRLITEATST
jgi:hypothetical protein